MLGSNALKKYGIETERISAEVYYSLRDEVVAKLNEIFVKAIDVKAYNNKKDFGDLDALCVPRGQMDYCEALKKVFDYNEIYANNPVFSFDYKNFQIDAIITQEDLFEIAYTYYSYNDLGNLMGRIAHKFGTKYGHDGLKLIYRSESDDKVLGKILISKDPARIFSYLGFDYERYLLGFDELQDIFDFVVDSDFFNPHIYAFEALDHQNRVRNKKRDSYKRFVNFCETTKFGREFFEFDKDKRGYYSRIDEFFPELNLQQQLADLRALDARKTEVKNKFNGHIVGKITKLSGRDLGDFIIHFKSKFDDFDTKILESEQNKINEAISEHFRSYKELKTS